MDEDTWKKAVLEMVRKIADVSYQKDAWFGTGDKISTPEEIYCELFDDYIFDDFLISDEVNLTCEQRDLGVKLRDLLNKYADSIQHLNVPEKVFVDSEWENIRCAAKKFMSAF